jgi:hypothetical protein
MIIGKIDKNEKKIKFHLDIKCTKCGKTVPGGMQTSESYFGSDSFKMEIDNFKKNYLCGICRDKKRLADKQQLF